MYCTCASVEWNTPPLPGDWPREPSSHSMKASGQDRHSLFLLLSLVFFLVLAHPLDEYGRIGDPVVLVLFSMILIAAAFRLSDQKALRRVAVPLVACVILVHLGAHFYPTMRPLIIATHVLSTVFFGFMSVALFAYLGRLWLPKTPTECKINKIR